MVLLTGTRLEPSGTNATGAELHADMRTANSVAIDIFRIIFGLFDRAGITWMPATVG